MKNAKENKTEKLQGYVGKSVKLAFLEFVEDEERSESKLLEILVKEALTARGYLK